MVGREPNPPAWPSSVHVFNPADDPLQMQAVVQAAYARNGGHSPIDHGQFSTARFAFLFRPGTYSVDVPVGYYTQVLGLGASPAEVFFDGPRGVYSEEGDQTNLGGALSTFWRSGENFRNRAEMMWAVSQAAPLRRIITDGDLALAEYIAGVGMGYSSGGFLGNVQIGGALKAGSQQQFCTRNARIARGMVGGVWNMVFIGTVGAPVSHCGLRDGRAGTVTRDTSPVIAEKPFIRIDANGKYFLQVPRVQRERVGPDFGLGTTIDFEHVHVALPGESAASINARLSAGVHVVLSPGIYELDSPLYICKHDQVLLGLGLATLVAAKGTAAIRVCHAVHGVRIAGVLLEAGPGETGALLEWGQRQHQGNADSPGFMHDIFARVGGANNQNMFQARAEVMVQINVGHVVGDNLWLWRADHGIGGLVRSGENPCRTGLVVNGNDVTMYGLAVEHTLGDLVQWSGERGRTFFYQSELPYDVTQAYADAGHVGYRVGAGVLQHQALGVGVYHFFRDFEVTMRQGIACPAWLANSFELPLAVYLSGRGQMLNVLNKEGGVTRKGQGLQVKWICSKGPAVPVPGEGAPGALIVPWAPAVRAALASGTPGQGFVGFDEMVGTSQVGHVSTGSMAARDAIAAEGRLSSRWLVSIITLQSGLLMLCGLYLLHLRRHSLHTSAQAAWRRESESTSSPAAEGQWSSTLRRPGHSDTRLRGLASMTRAMGSGPSPAERASPAESAFGARSPVWAPEEL